MATVEPFLGTRYNPEHVKLGGVLAPPYDVITDAQREELYGRDLRNIVRIDYGIAYPEDVDGVDDRYTRAASFLTSWRDLGVLVRDEPPGFYVVDHHFQHPDGTRAAPARAARDRGGDVVGVVRSASARAHPARSQGRPSGADARHARADEPGLRRVDGRRRYRRNAGRSCDGRSAARRDASTARSAPRSCCSGASPNRQQVAAIAGCPARRRAVRRRRASPLRDRRGLRGGAPRGRAGCARRTRPFERCLVYLAAADDPGITILPTHRLVRPGPGIAFSLDDLWARLDDVYETEPAADAPGRARGSVGDAGHPPRVRGGRPRRCGGAPPAAACRRVAARPARCRGARNRGARTGRRVAETISGGALAYTRDPDGARRGGAQRRGDPRLRRIAGERRAR